jgi:hypothetical protein
MLTTEQSSRWLSTKFSCSSSSTWAKSIPPANIKKKLLDHGKLGYSTTAEHRKKVPFAGRHWELEMRLYGLLVVARTCPSSLPSCVVHSQLSDSYVSGNSWPGRFPPSSPWPPYWTCFQWNHKAKTHRMRKDWPRRTRGGGELEVE